MYIDAHNHLHDVRLHGARNAIIKDCERLGVSLAVVNGTSPTDWKDVQALASHHSWILPSYGVHPWYCEGLAPSWRRELEGYLSQGHSAIGEIGIDYWKGGVDRELQRRVFLEQLSVACERNLPTSIHGLKAWDDLYALMKKHGAPSAGFLLHSYSGPTELIEKFVRLGAYLSCAPAFFASSRAHKLEVFKRVPLERLLPESDAPDQGPPQLLRRFSCGEDEKINHPGNVSLVYEGLARLTGLSVETLSVTFVENAQRLFRTVMQAPLRA